MENHLTPQEIQSFIDGRQTAGPRERMLEHLDRCRMCVKLLADAMQEGASRKGSGFDIRKNPAADIRITNPVSVSTAFCMRHHRTLFGE